MIEEQRKMDEERQKLKKEQEKRVKEEQKKILGKNNSRPKLSFSLKPLSWVLVIQYESCIQNYGIVQMYNLLFVIDFANSISVLVMLLSEIWLT